LDFNSARRRSKIMLVKDVSTPLKKFMDRSTFREDPLPDRPMKERPVSLPRVKWLERPDP
jgi:hypothetical protein